MMINKTNSKKMQVEGNFYKVVSEFPVLWHGLGYDNKGYLLEDSYGRYHFCLTSHETPYLVRPYDILEKVDEYENALKKTKQALVLFSSNCIGH